MEEPIGIPAPNEMPTSEPEEAVHSEKLALVQRRRPLASPGFTLSWADESRPPPLEDAEWPVSIPLGAQLELTSMWSMQVTISHYPVMGEVQYQYQSQVIAQMSLQVTPSKPSD